MIDATEKQMTVAATIYLFILGDVTESDQTYNSGSSKETQNRKAVFWRKATFLPVTFTLSSINVVI